MYTSIFYRIDLHDIIISRFHSCGRLWYVVTVNFTLIEVDDGCCFRDVLCELASAGDFPLPQPSPPSNNKRERGADSPISASSVATSSTSSPGFSEAPRAIAGSRRVESRIPSAT